MVYPTGISVFGFWDAEWLSCLCQYMNCKTGMPAAPVDASVELCVFHLPRHWSQHSQQQPKYLLLRLRLTPIQLSV